MGFLCCPNYVLFGYTVFCDTCYNIHSYNWIIFHSKEKAPLKAGFYHYTSFEYLPETYLFLFLYFIPFQLFTVSPV